MNTEPSPVGGPPTGTDRPSEGCPSIAVVPAQAADLAILSDVIAEAFHPLAPAEWLIPDPDARRDIFPGYFGLFVEHALAWGVVHTTPALNAVALWIPVGPGGPVAPARYAERLATATGRWVHRFRAFDAAVDARHPVGFSHQHLSMLAVRPGQQGQGIGTALLRAHHQTLDSQNMAAYLEASDLRTRQLYLRHGYADHGAPVQLPGGPRMYPMLRRRDRLAGKDTYAD
jgi:GNAT superfamily N-acetyltransferase